MEDRDWPSERYGWYGVGVLMLPYALSFTDRQLLSLMFETIKRDLGLSDTMVSLLHGTAFALFYTFVGIPIGRWVDRGNRVAIIALGIVTWSTMTALCGLAGAFTTLFLARMGVGIGEAALSPAATSIVGDYFRP